MLQKNKFMALVLLCCVNAYAQNTNTNNTKNINLGNAKVVDTTKATAVNNEKDFSDIQLAKLNSLLTSNNYTEFYDYIKTTNVSGEKYISYLNSKKFEGHVPLYWLMADYYSKQTNKAEETHFWYDTSIIMTQQDAALCYDDTAKYATQKLSKSFSQPIHVIRDSPQYNDIVMPKVIFFISNIKQRISPKWVCVFGDNPVRAGNYVLKPNTDWQEIRQNVFKKYTKNYPQ